MEKISSNFFKAPNAKANVEPLPLQLWLYITATSISLISLFYIFFLPTPPPPSEAFYQYNAPRLSALKQEKKKKIIMLGDSRLRYATYSDNDMEILLSSKTNKDMSVVRLVNNWAVFNEFNQLIPLMLNTHPDLFVIQENVITKSRTYVITKILARQHLMWSHFGTGIWDPGNSNQYSIQNEMSCSATIQNETVDERRKRATSWFNYKRKSENNNNFNEFIKTTQLLNIPVIFISIPITSKGTLGLPHPPKMTTAKVYSPASSIPDEHFCDLVHMNDNGRVIFSNWLSEVIIKKLSGNIH